MKIKIIISTIACTLLFTSNIKAQHEEQHHDNSNHDTEHHDKHHDDEHHSKHHVALFNGATTNIDHDLTGYTLGVDYIYSLSKMFGVGAAAEYIFAGDGEIVLGIPFAIHPYKGLLVVLSPIGINAAEHSNDHADDNTGGHKAGTTGDVNRGWHFGARLSLGYSFHVGKFAVTPLVSYDRVNTSAFVYGISFGMGF